MEKIHRAVNRIDNPLVSGVWRGCRLFIATGKVFLAQNRVVWKTGEDAVGSYLLTLQIKLQLHVVPRNQVGFLPTLALLQGTAVAKADQLLQRIHLGATGRHVARIDTESSTCA